MRIHFYLDAVEDQEATQREGHPVYRDVEKVRISGMQDAFGIDNTCIRDTYVSEQHKNQYASEYRTFKDSLRESVVGTPIKLWPAVTLAQVRTLAEVGITTVEQLSNVDPKELRTREWLEPLHAKATSWLKSLTDNGEVLRLEQRVLQLEKELEVAKFETAELVKQVVLERSEKKRAVKATD